MGAHVEKDKINAVGKKSQAFYKKQDYYWSKNM